MDDNIKVNIIIPDNDAGNLPLLIDRFESLEEISPCSSNGCEIVDSFLSSDSSTLNEEDFLNSIDETDAEIERLEYFILEVRKEMTDKINILESTLSLLRDFKKATILKDFNQLDKSQNG